MTVVPGRLGFGFWASLGPTTAALGPPTSVGAVCSLQAAKSAVSAEVVIKRRRIGILPSGISSTHANPSRAFCLSRLSINLWLHGVDLRCSSDGVQGADQMKAGGPREPALGMRHAVAGPRPTAGRTPSHRNM